MYYAKKAVGLGNKDENDFRHFSSITQKENNDWIK
jgi:hypothetical protein